MNNILFVGEHARTYNVHWHRHTLWELVFASNDPRNPARFYSNSCLAHRSCPAVHIPMDKARYNHLGGLRMLTGNICAEFGGILAYIGKQS